MVKSKNPKPEDIQREFEEFVQQRFGDSVQVFSSNIEPSKNDAQIQAEEEPKSAIESFNHTPQEIKKYLDQFVIKQDEAKKALAIAVCDHYHHAKLSGQKDDYSYAKQNVLLLGPTGVGKTYLIKKIADFIGVPFVKADATRFSETGYVGANVDDLVRDLVTAADDDLERARFGIVYLDEADKIASRGHQNSPTVSSRGVQFGLLRLMEDCDVDLKSGNDIHSQMQIFMDMQSGSKKPSKISTKHILFIVSGAFSGLSDIIERRLNKSPIGFHRGDEKNEQTLLQQVSTDDFLEFGFEAEFIGRLPVRVSCEPLEASDLENILLNSKDSILEQYRQSFKAYGINLSFGPGSLSAIAELASKEQTGARSLMTVCERLMRHYKYELPSLDIDDFVFTKEMVYQPERELQILIKSVNDEAYRQSYAIMDKFEENFLRKHSVKITLDEGLREALIAKCEFDSNLINTYLCEIFQSYEHGLALLKSRYGVNSVVISKEAMDSPQEYLENLITQTYDEFIEKNR